MKKTIIALSLALSSVAVQAATHNDNNRVVGGQPIDISQAPYQVALVNQSGQQFCGGTLIREDWVVTAAHCLWGISPGRVTVVAGKTRRSELRGGVHVSAIHKYPGFYDTKNGKDIALLKLSVPVDLSDSKIQAIDYVTSVDASSGLTAPGTVATLTGWGRMGSPGATPDHLQWVQMPIVSLADAEDAFATRYGIHGLTQDQLPTWADNKSACHGDSGGPLVVPKGNTVVLAGVVSWGKDCADLAPSMFARVSSFDNWIRGYVGDPVDTDAPSVSITTPADYQRFDPGESITISAQASDVDGTIAHVRFYQNGQLLAEDSDAPYSFTWHGAAKGDYKIHAVATDNDALSTNSKSVNISVASDDVPTCDGVEAWSASKVYPRPGAQVSYEGNVFENKWWTQGEVPSESGQWGVWRFVKACR